MVKTYQKLIDRLKKCGIKPKMHILDNECSEEFKQAIEGNNMKYQLVPPHNHRRNIAERAIQTFKAHFISTLCGVDPNFPLALWCYLLPQAEMTLNMLTPNVSSYAHLHGQHDYNAHHLHHLVCSVKCMSCQMSANQSLEIRYGLPGQICNCTRYDIPTIWVGNNVGTVVNEAYHANNDNIPNSSEQALQIDNDNGNRGIMRWIWWNWTCNLQS